MHVPVVDRPLDEAEWREFVGPQGFGQLLAAGRDRDVPVAVPIQYVLDGRDVLAHVVARNPLLEALAERPRCVLSVAGDWAFVPSAWKAVAGEDPLLGIPTTYYAAVQLQGTARVVADPDELAALLRRQLAVLQPGVAVADPATAHRPKLAQIRGIRLVVDDVLAKFKYGGNVDEAHRREVRRRLTERGGPGDLAAAERVRRRLKGPDASGSAFRR